MIALVQRVAKAAVSVPSSGYRASIGPGLCVLLGVEAGDEARDAEWIAGKLAKLRIFRDDAGRFDRSVVDIEGEILVVSQFTLAGDCRKGNRPSFTSAAPPALGRRLYGLACRELCRQTGRPVRTGRFGAMMHVELVNDGPVTLIVRSREQ